MDNSRDIAATLIGAGIGALAGFLFFTERGRTVRRQLEPALEDLSRELISFRRTMNRATGVAGDGWRLLNEALGETANLPKFPGRQTSPF
jgi:hypothetical protein